MPAPTAVNANPIAATTQARDKQRIREDLRRDWERDWERNWELISEDFRQDWERNGLDWERDRERVWKDLRREWELNRRACKGDRERNKEVNPPVDNNDATSDDENKEQPTDDKDGPTVVDEIYDNTGSDDDKYNNNDDSYDKDFSYDDEGFYSNEGYHSHHHKGYDTTEINKVVEECEHDLHVLWDTFLSLTSHSHTFVNHQLDHPVRTPTSPPTIQPGWIYNSWGGPLYNYG